jgi:ribosome maturation factor RimP
MTPIKDLVNTAVEAIGCEVVQFKNFPKHTVRVLVDHEPDGVTVDELATITRSVNVLFEESGRDPGEYTIEILSPGLDRPLVREKDFVRFAGQQVHVKLKEKRSLDGRSNFRGTLIGLDEGEVVVTNPDDKDEPWRFLRREIAMTRLIPDVKFAPEKDQQRKRKPRKSRRKRPKGH